MPRKEVNTEESRNAEHNTGNCQFLLMPTVGRMTICLQKFTPEMQDDVRLLATYDVHSSVIVEVLQHKNPGKYIYNHDVYNLINSICCHENQSKSYTGSVYLNLMKQQQENLSFHINAQFEGQENYLVWLC
ncbi:8434_t:CDS:2 [Diversispora eburnea]|uniref:8434_t:CDS:1 n=1 Tax=Diversispora eburnea TaxID=1213867 RepID=A0A9N9FBS3_9GLOM|nr:8434_t:CDS:2 [Diversispora eburnea]